jgi:tetratricopeptide (TPR) repeat protein
VGLLALVGVFFEWKAYRRRALGLALAWAGLVGAVGVFSNFSGKRLPLLEDYSVSSWVFLALFSGLGAWGLLRLWEKGQAFVPVLGALLLALCLGGVGYRVAHNGQSRYTCGYDYTLNVWKPLPKNALFFCEGDYLQFPCWYFQWVEGRRSDLCVIGSSLCMDCNRIQMARDHPGLKVPYPNHDPDKTYYFGALDSWMMKNNPQRRCFFTFPPKLEGVENLNQDPLGLTREGTASPQKPVFDQASNDSFWSSARIRSLRPEASVDIRSWNTVLQDYGAKRLALALYEMNRGTDLENSGPGNSPKARRWYEKSLANLLAVKDWNPPGSQKFMNDGVNPKQMGDLLPDVFFHQSILVTIGVVYFHLGDMEQARVWIQQGTQNVMRDSDVYLFAGIVAFQAHNLPEARKWINKTLELDPSNPQAGRILKYIDQQPGS